MDSKVIAILIAMLVFGTTAYAVVPTTVILINDTNVYFPEGSVVTIPFTALDADAPTDANILLTYRDNTSVTKIEINGELDQNSNNFCTNPLGAAAQECTATWTLPAGLDNNIVVDVNVYDITNGDDANSSAQPQIDTNACFTTLTQLANNRVLLDANCTGWGAIGGRVPRIGFTKSRVISCGDNFGSNEDPTNFGITLGEFTICFRSTDALGNQEAQQVEILTSEGGAFTLIVLTEMVIAALLIFAILASFILFGAELNFQTMMALVLGAIVTVIAIFIFAIIV